MSNAATFTLTGDQERARAGIQGAMLSGVPRVLLTGDPGTGKTTLLPLLAAFAKRQKKQVVFSATTHKAVAVLAKKLAEAGYPYAECVTLDRLLSLKPKIRGDRKEFIRDPKAEPITADIVVIDECSMVPSDRIEHIRLHLPTSFVLYVGDPGQLPPVGEAISKTFSCPVQFHLSEIVRQAEGNAILAAARAIRSQQGGPLDMTWCRSAHAAKAGIFRPHMGKLDDWMASAFGSPEYAKDPDRFRYLAYTNRRVAEMNERIRRWRFPGGVPNTPFAPGERVMFRDALVCNGAVIFQNSEEATVLEIARDEYRHPFKPTMTDNAWIAVLPAWRMTLVRYDLSEHTVYAPADLALFDQMKVRLKDEADRTPKQRWGDYHRFIGSLADIQHCDALTVHRSQGSTFHFAFLDVPDILARARTNVLECQQLFLVGLTRPTTGLVLVGG